MLVTSVTGCGVPAAALSGDVKFDGNAIKEGTIRLVPIEGTKGTGGSAKIAEGKYDIPREGGLTAGKYEVMIMATEQRGFMRAEGASGEGGTEQVPRIVQYIPESYNTATTLRVELSGGKNEKSFDLKPGGS